MTQLTDVRIETDAFDRTFNVYHAICSISSDASSTLEVAADESSASESLSGGSPPNQRTGRFALGTATVTLVEARYSASGVTAVTITVSDLAKRRRALAEFDIPFREKDDELIIEPEFANGIRVLIQSGQAEVATSDTGSKAAAASESAKIDHLALRVQDLAAASARWSAITGVESEQMGLHPVSGGAFSAARFPLGERMIELVAPEPGVPSALADRLTSHGEGPAALALPAQDLEATLARLRKLDVRVLDRPPHWMVHPRDGGGVILQLTPRVVHEPH